MILEVMGFGVLFTTVQSAISAAEICTYTSGDTTCSGDKSCSNVCDTQDCEKLTCVKLAFAIGASIGECYSANGVVYQTAECEDVSVEAIGCDGDDVDLCMRKCSSVDGTCEDCTDEKLDMSDYGVAGLDCDRYIAIGQRYYPEFSEYCSCSTREFVLSGTTNDFMIGCKSACAMDSDSGSGKDNIGMIIGIVIGAVVLVVVVIAVVFCMRRKKL
jgi:hypothetical protein